MNSTEVARRYHDAWNGRDADALITTSTKDGTFCNPDTYPGGRPEALAAYVRGLGSFPRFSSSSCLMLVKSSRTAGRPSLAGDEDQYQQMGRRQ